MGVTIFDRSLESMMPDGIPANARIASFIHHPQLEVIAATLLEQLIQSHPDISQMK
ncbi:hypothetical protein [Chamaesiphon minutus]|uniref:Uncharacterized protein n=1 Tax=Chamaesiphon minutus (strain ATCC 27169 / PCC 6605) TaxID=1173020 RepID=K9UC48_CHAP6|nr:hypothetical protein [Chamaesiphon minutus]AFY92692.1 hypothetical protein Cha6605_1533 [Chamaesiphon minutus PCC 6605]